MSQFINSPSIIRSPITLEGGSSESVTKKRSIKIVKYGHSAPFKNGGKKDHVIIHSKLDSKLNLKRYSSEGLLNRFKRGFA